STFFVLPPFLLAVFFLAPPVTSSTSAALPLPFLSRSIGLSFRCVCFRAGRPARPPALLFSVGVKLRDPHPAPGLGAPVARVLVVLGGVDARDLGVVPPRDPGEGVQTRPDELVEVGL